MECPSCHSRNAPGASHCVACGADLSLTAPSPGICGAAPEPSRTVNLATGSIFAGRYRIAGEIGRGGMGVVYKAEDLRLKRAVALKLLPWSFAGESLAKQRFIHEAQTASGLDHPNICTIYEVDETPDGQMFIAMAFCEGETLARRIDRGPSEVVDALDIAIGLCAGLGAAHAAGIVHRDVKPGNVMLRDVKRARIVDFGLAKLAGDAQLTTSGVAVGTVDYMSPEQARGDDVDSRADIWAVGVVLYEMLTGKRPFRGDTQQAVIHSILQGAPESVPRLRADVPSDLAAVIDRCLKMDPADRYQAAADLQADLEAIRGGAGSAGAPARRSLAGRRRRGWARRPLGLRIAAAAVAAVALAGALAAVLPPGRPVLTLQPGRPWVRLWIGPPALPAEKMLAVLPFDARGTAADRALCDGIVAVSTEKLSRIAAAEDSFWVKPFSAVINDSARTPQQARDRLGANLAIIGSLDWRGDVITARADLVDTGNGRRLRTSALSDPIANLSTWQEGLVLLLADMLGVKVPAGQAADLKAGCTALPAAYVSYLRGWGRLSAAAPQFEDAITEFARAIAEDSSYAAAYIGMGEAWLRRYDREWQGEWLEKAADWSRRAIQVNNRLPAAFNLAGRVSVRERRLDEAADAFARAVALDSTHCDSYYWLGYVRLTRREYAEAEEALLAGVRLRPRDFAGYHYLGNTYYCLNRLDEAKQAFERAMLLKPTAGRASNIASLYARAQLYADADLMYRRAREMDPDNYRILANHADACYWTPGKRDTALVMFRDAIGMAEARLPDSPNDALVLADLASYCSMVGERAKAESLLGEVLLRDPASVDLLERVAETFEQLGRRDDALVWLEKALAAGYPVDLVDTYPGWRNARADERFRRIRERY